MTNAIAVRDPALLQPTEWAQAKEMASILVRSGMIPTSIRTPEAALAIILKGREMGVAPMRAFAQISIINGKPAVGAELMLSKIFEKFPSAPIDIVENSPTAAVIMAARPGREQVKFSFTIDDAKRAGLHGKDTWAKYPQNMLYWRCVANMARALFPDCLHGASHTPDELGAEVNEDGEVVKAPPQAAYVAQPALDAEVVPEAPTLPIIYTATDKEKSLVREIFARLGWDAKAKETAKAMKLASDVCVEGKVPLKSLEVAIREHLGLDVQPEDAP